MTALEAMEGVTVGMEVATEAGMVAVTVDMEAEMVAMAVVTEEEEAVTDIGVQITKPRTAAMAMDRRAGIKERQAVLVAGTQRRRAERRLEETAEATAAVAVAARRSRYANVRRFHGRCPGRSARKFLNLPARANLNR